MEIEKLDDIALFLNDIYLLPNDNQDIISEENQKEDGTSFASYVRLCKGQQSEINLKTYRFDDNINNPNHPILFPFFKHNTGAGLNKNCDYVVFAQKGDEFYVLLVEMKSTSGKPQRQLEISQTFINFIIERFNVCGIRYSPKIRKIGINDVSGMKSRYKNLTRNQDFQYNEDGYVAIVCADTTIANPYSIRLEKVLV